MNLDYLLHLLVFGSIYTIVALGLNIVVGYCGLLPLSQAAFFAVGSYSCALGMNHGWSFWSATLLGIVLASLLSLVVSIPAWRFKGDFFVLLTLAVQAIATSLLLNWKSLDAPVGTWQNLTNGAFGITNIPRPTLFGFQFNDLGAMTLLALALLAFCALIAWKLSFSPWQRLLNSMRDDELVLRGLGKNTRLAKVQAFAFASAMAALAGALYASYVGFIDPSIGSLEQSIFLLSLVLVGGSGNFVGPVVGTVVVLAIPEALRFVPISDAVAASIRLIAYGSLLVLLMHFRPQGIAGRYRIQ